MRLVIVNAHLVSISHLSTGGWRWMGRETALRPVATGTNWLNTNWLINSPSIACICRKWNQSNCDPTQSRPEAIIPMLNVWNSLQIDQVVDKWLELWVSSVAILALALAMMSPLPLPPQSVYLAKPVVRIDLPWKCKTNHLKWSPVCAVPADVSLR